MTKRKRERIPKANNNNSNAKEKKKKVFVLFALKTYDRNWGREWQTFFFLAAVCTSKKDFFCLRYPASKIEIRMKSRKNKKMISRMYDGYDGYDIIQEMTYK